MINLTFKEKTPPIDRFPNDDIFRVVWAYGSVQKGLTVTGVPEIHILLVDLFFNTLKNELIYQHYYRTEKELYTAVEEFAYVHYNHVRPHSYNNYKTPYEARYGVE